MSDTKTPTPEDLLEALRRSLSKSGKGASLIGRVLGR